MKTAMEYMKAELPGGGHMTWAWWSDWLTSEKWLHVSWILYTDACNVHLLGCLGWILCNSLPVHTIGITVYY